MDVHIIIFQGPSAYTITNPAPALAIGFNHSVNICQAKMLIT